MLSGLKSRCTMLALALALAGCCPKPTAPVVPYCMHPGITCTPHEQAPPEVQAELVEQAWCCDYEEDPPCVPVEFLSQCGPDEIAFYCQYGRSVPAGPNGFECYG